MKISILLSLAATGTDSVAPNSRLVLEKLTEVASSWADFYIKDVLSRDNRAENFKLRIKKKTDRIASDYEKCLSKPRYNRKRKRRSPGVRELGGGNLFNPDGSKAQNPIPLDPTRSSKQIFNNIRNWIWDNMDGCRQQSRWWHKLGSMEQKWLTIYHEVLEKVDARRSG